MTDPLRVLFLKQLEHEFLNHKCHHGRQRGVSNQGASQEDVGGSFPLCEHRSSRSFHPR